jgi:hypothetical protein
MTNTPLHTSTPPDAAPQARAAAPRGFALPVAIFAIGVIGVLVTGGFFIARQETRIGVSSQKGAEAFYLAELGVSNVLDNWQAASFSQMAMGDSVMRSGSTSEGDYDVNITRLSNWLYFLDSRATISSGGPMLRGASRRVGTLAKVRTLDIRPRAALTTVHSLRVGGSSQIIGQDEHPPEWGSLCDPADLTDKPGVLIDDPANLSTNGNAWDIDGNPAVDSDPTLTSASLLVLGNLTWDQLKAMANITLSPGVSITQVDPDSISSGTDWICNKSNNRNWGDPLNPGSVCGGHFPIIYARGDVGIQSSDAGQGILLVEGDLKLAGGFNFYGPVVVRGELSTAGTGGHVHGGLIAANVNLDTSTVLGNAVVQYSSCAVTRAVLNNSRLTFAVPLSERSWVDLTNIGN